MNTLCKENQVVYGMTIDEIIHNYDLYHNEQAAVDYSAWRYINFDNFDYKLSKQDQETLETLLDAYEKIYEAASAAKNRIEDVWNKNHSFGFKRNIDKHAAAMIDEICYAIEETIEIEWDLVYQEAEKIKERERL